MELHCENVVARGGAGKRHAVGALAGDEIARRGLTAGECVYGVTFACAAARENVFAVQFHPEKSSAAGLQLLTNFLAWQPAVPRPKQKTAA